MKIKKQPKIALALGGGGALGIAHIGVLQVLSEACIKPDIIYGTSVGACIGAYYALNRDLHKLEREVIDASHRWAMRHLIDFSLLRGAILKGKKLEQFLIDRVGEVTFGKTKIPLVAVATDLATGEAVELSTGRLIPALLASSAVPGIFPAVKIGRRYLIDGGVVCQTPMTQALASGAELVIAVDLFFRKRIELERQPKLIETLTLAYEIMRIQSNAANMCVNSSRVICIKPEFKGGSISSNFRFDDGLGYVEAGREAAQLSLPYIRQKIAKLVDAKG